MPWGSAFVAALTADRRSPRYILEVVAVHQEPRGGSYSIGSHYGLGSDDSCLIACRDDGGVEVQGQSVTPVTWSATRGQFDVTVVGDPTELLQNITRGTFVALRVGFDGMAASDFECVALGVVRNARGYPQLRIECYDFFDGFRQRPVRDYNSLTLFNDLGTSTTLVNAHAPGINDPMQVNSTTGFQKETGGVYLIKVSPTGADPYYLTATGATATEFSGLSSTGKIGTTASVAAAGDSVKETAYLKGHPFDIVRKILCSTGNGTNGTYDTLPANWGLAIPHDLVDNDDIDRWKTEVVKVGSGSYEWEIAVEDEWTDAIATLEGLLATAGIFLTMRQGKITLRAAQKTTSVNALVSDIEITDSDIEDIEDYEAWDASHSVEYAQLYVPTASTAFGTNATEDLATLPGARNYTYDVADRVSNNESEIRTDMHTRLEEAARYIPERVQTRLANLKAAQLSPGDVVPLTTSRVFSRAAGSQGFQKRNAFVQDVSPDWDEGRVLVNLLVYPTTSDVFPP